MRLFTAAIHSRSQQWHGSFFGSNKVTRILDSTVFNTCLQNHFFDWRFKQFAFSFPASYSLWKTHICRRLRTFLGQTYPTDAAALSGSLLSNEYKHGCHYTGLATSSSARNRQIFSRFS